MPDKDFGGGSNEFRVVAQGLHGHRAKKRHYDDMTDEELYADIDNRRNAIIPTVIDPDEGDQSMGPASPQNERGRWEDQ